jgi:hypothetical protein
MTPSDAPCAKQARPLVAVVILLWTLSPEVSARLKIAGCNSALRSPTTSPRRLAARPPDRPRKARISKARQKFLTTPGSESPQQQLTPTPTPLPTPTPEQVKKDDNAVIANHAHGQGDAPAKEALQYPLNEGNPLGAAGQKTIAVTDPATDEFIPLPDRWRFGWPRHDRYQPKRQTPYAEGSLFDPYNQNFLKGDYPISGNHTFLNLNLQSVSVFNPRTVAAGGRRDQFFTNQNLVFGAEIFKGDTVFEPKRIAVRVTTVLNFNFLANDTLNPFKSKLGKTRLAVEEAFVEKRLAVISPNFDFVAVRAGMQNFTSDFRGFLFSENQLGIRFFGNAHSNRDQYNVAYFNMRQRDEVSQLHLFDRRRQHVFIANWFRQDFLTKGYTAMVNFHFNNDHGITPGDRARLNVAYLGIHGDGRIGTWAIDHAFYQALGRDDSNRLARHSVDVNAQMAALELSRDKDWLRYRGSFFFASGDNDLNDGKANGFDMISDNPNFAGGPFQFWTQQATVLGGGRGILTNKFSLLANLRNKFTQRSNFVNPGLLLVNVGADFRLTPKLKAVTNVSYLRFARAGVLRQLTNDPGIDNRIGADLSVGLKFRPLLNENMAYVVGVSALFPQGGYARLINSTRPLVSPTFAVQFAF